jgi:hypothetical protein
LSYTSTIWKKIVLALMGNGAPSMKVVASYFSTIALCMEPFCVNWLLGKIIDLQYHKFEKKNITKLPIK